MAQEVFTRLVVCLKAFDYEPGRGRFRGYLKTVTHRLMADLKERPAPNVVLGNEAMLVEIEAREDLLDRLASMFDLELLAQAKDRVRNRLLAVC